jgi:large subunit ribosomal protein L29
MKKKALRKELREKEVEALKKELEDKRKQVFTLRTQAVSQKLENPHLITTTRHEIARIKTVLREKQLAKK